MKELLTSGSYGICCGCFCLLGKVVATLGGAGLGECPLEHVESAGSLALSSTKTLVGDSWVSPTAARRFMPGNIINMVLALRHNEVKNNIPQQHTNPHA
jgi:hypothetical protein